MSQQRIKSIQIKNFKAFQDLKVNLDSRHLLAYGGNGSGKSSLYWALYTFLQSGGKPTDQVQKYFDPTHKERLLNIHADAGNTGEITLTLQNADGSSTTGYTISKDQHGTLRKPEIVKGNLASDFITYRVLFKFYQFTNSQQINLWRVFKQEILPFCRSSVLENPYEHWIKIKDNPFNEAQQKNLRGVNAANLYDRYDKNCELLNRALHEILNTLSIKAQEFYTKYFQESSEPKLKLKVGLTREAKYDRRERKQTNPAIGLAIWLGENEILKPQTFLNEGKLTQIALSIRFAASLVNLQDSSLKLLVLDDLLISLDMDNRMKVVDIILGDDFAGYQKIILTHKLGFFQEFQRRIGAEHSEWCFKKFSGEPTATIGLNTVKTDLQMAEDHLNGHDLEEAGIRLRKAAEKTALLYREWATRSKVPPGEFHSLTEHLRIAKDTLLATGPMKLCEQIIGCLPEGHKDRIVPRDDSDIDTDTGLSAAQKGIIKKQRRRLKLLVTEEYEKTFEVVKLLGRIKDMTDRVLNPVSHSGDTPLYEREMRQAHALISRLEQIFPGLGPAP